MVQFRPLLRSGWPVIPLSPDGKKTPLVSGYHGKGAKVADEDTVRRWSSQWPDCNPAIVLPPGVIGFDVDGASHGGGVDGLLALAEFEARFGALPASGHIYHGTDGGTGVSPYGTRLYRIPESMLRVYTPGKIVGNLNKVTGLGGVDIIAPWIRYNVAPGAVHHSGEVYGFTPSVHPDLPGSEGFVPWLPRPADLPELTEAHVRALLTVRGQRGPSGEPEVAPVAPKVRTATGRTEKTLVSATPSPSAVPSSERGKALLDQVRALAALEEGETLLIEGEERGWQRGNGFYVLACAIARVAKDRDKARRLFVRAAGDFYDAERQWENALAAVELDDEIADEAEAIGAYPVTAVGDPYPFVDEYLTRHYRNEDGVLTLRHADLMYWLWCDGADGAAHYRPLTAAETSARVARDLRGAQEVSEGTIRQIRVNRRVKSEVMGALQDLTLVSEHGAGVLKRPIGGVPFRNGWLDIKTGVLGPLDPSMDIRWIVPGDYDPNAASPVEWFKFLDSIGYSEDSGERDLLQEWLGYVLSGETAQQKALMLVGPPRAGKGTVLMVAEEMMGEGAVGLDLGAFGTNFGLQPIIGKGLATVGDARFEMKTDKGTVRRLLSLISRDTISIDRKGKDPVSIRSGTRLMLATNEVPALLEASKALSTRFMFLKFSESYLGREDLGIQDRVLAEIPGIVKWALVGLERLHRNGSFTVTEAGTSLQREMGEIGNPITIFVTEECELVESSFISTDDLYNEYAMWATRHGHYVPASSIFGRDLNAAFPDSVVKRGQKRRGSKMVRGFFGIKFGV